MGPEHIGAWAVRHAARERQGWEAAVTPQAAPRPRLRPFGLRPAAVALGFGLIAAGGWRLWQRPPGPAAAFNAPAARVAAETPPPASNPAAPDDAGPFFVRPGASPATLFRYDVEAHRYVADGRLQAFAMLRVRRMVPDSGMAELAAAPDADAGGARARYVLADALESGDAHAALVSRCVYQAGRPPEPGEVFSAAAPPDEKLRLVPVDNTGDLPAVFSLRDAEGRTVVSVFLAPHGSAALPLAAGTYRAEYASGDLWSRACGRFVAGGRAARARAGPLPPRYVLPIAGAVELPDGDLSSAP